MLTTSLKHHWLAVTAIALTGLLSTISVNANPVTYTASGMHGALSVRFTTESTASETGTFQSVSAGTYVMSLSDRLIASTRGDFQEADDLTSFVENSHLISLTGYDADTPNVLKSRAALTQPDPNKLASGGIILLLRRLFIGLAPLRKAITLLAEVVPTPAALVLLGSVLLALVFGIRRITTRNEAEDKGDSAEERPFGINTEPKANHPETELVGPMAPLFHQNRTGPKDSISLSQPS